MYSADHRNPQRKDYQQEINMKKIFAIAFLLSTAAAQAHASNRLSELENGFVGVVAATSTVVLLCDAKTVKDSIPKIADRMGMDDRMLPAVRAAFEVSVDAPYERSDLVPEVTRFFKTMTIGVADEIKTNKVKACANWIDALRKIGTIE
jgi:hypothetical protein